MSQTPRLSLLVWLLAFCLQAAHAQDGVDVSRIPSRPPGQILDQARWFTEDEKESAREELGRLFTENNIDIYLVTLEKLPPQGAETYTRTLGNTWARSPVWCIIFQVPGDPAGFHVEAGGVEMHQAYVDQTIKEAIRRARRENTEKDRVMAAWRECSENLRFIYASRQRTNEKQADANQEYFANQKKSKFRKRAYIAAGAGGLLVLLAVIIFIVRRIRAKRATYVFPETSWRTRFQGPHSGGSGIVVNYRSKRLK